MLPEPQTGTAVQHPACQTSHESPCVGASEGAHRTNETMQTHRGSKASCGGQRVTLLLHWSEGGRTWDCSMECLAGWSEPAWCRSSTASLKSTAAFRASSTNLKRTDLARRSSHG